MNYLIHAFLSPDDQDILLGNLCADMLRPDDAEKLSPAILSGIELHHRIDRVTDHHKASREARKLFTEANVPYQGVVTDIMYDHFMALHWKEYSDETLKSFSARIYSTLKEKAKEIPGRFPLMANYMIKDNWFESYGKPEGFQTALERVSFRTTKPLQICAINYVLTNNLDILTKGFREIMTSLMADE